MSQYLDHNFLLKYWIEIGGVGKLIKNEINMSEISFP